jgi:hypothetical protein
MRRFAVLLIGLLVTLSACCSIVGPPELRAELECLDATAMVAAACASTGVTFDLEWCIEANAHAALTCGTDL